MYITFLIFHSFFVHLHFYISFKFLRYSSIFNHHSFNFLFNHSFIFIPLSTFSSIILYSDVIIILLSYLVIGNFYLLPHPSKFHFPSSLPSSFIPLTPPCPPPYRPGSPHEATPLGTDTQSSPQLRHVPEDGGLPAVPSFIPWHVSLSFRWIYWLSPAGDPAESVWIHQQS